MKIANLLKRDAISGPPKQINMTLQQLAHHVSAVADNHRSKHNLSLTDLARELGVTRSQMERVLEGYCEDIAVLEKVLEGMGMEVVQTKEGYEQKTTLP